METITFLPDRLNAEPVVFKGSRRRNCLSRRYSVFKRLAGRGAFVFFGWLALPTISLLMPLLVIILGGKLMARFKRGKPENYLYRRFDLWLSQQGLGHGRLIHHDQRWALRRSQQVIRPLEDHHNE